MAKLVSLIKISISTRWILALTTSSCRALFRHKLCSNPWDGRDPINNLKSCLNFSWSWSEKDGSMQSSNTYHEQLLMASSTGLGFYEKILSIKLFLFYWFVDSVNDAEGSCKAWSEYWKKPVATFVGWNERAWIRFAAGFDISFTMFLIRTW